MLNVLVTYLKQFLIEAKLKDVMIKSFPTVYEDDEFSEVQRKFHQTAAYYCVVLNRDDTLAGLISHRYLYKTLSPRRFFDSESKVESEIVADPDILLDEDGFYSKETLDSFIIRNVMLKDPTSLSGEDSLSTALTIMYERNRGCIPILTKDRKVCGILTREEVIHFLASVIKK